MQVKARAVIVIADRLVVAEERRAGQRHLTLPGGRPTRTETLDHAVMREVQEEVGVTVSVGPLLYVAEVVSGHSVQELNIIFLCELDDPRANPNSLLTIGADDAARSEVMPPILDVIFEDLAGRWSGTPRYLGNVHVVANSRRP